ncbi:MAG TPA: hypothetical protein VIJ53_08545, partial [Acidobacteriaceae bacterium]
FGELIHGSNALVRAAVNGWTVSGITSWQAGGSLEQEVQGGFVQQLSLSYDNLPANAGAQGITSSIGPNTYYGTDAPLNIMAVLTCNPTSGLASKQRVKLGCFAAPAIGQYGGQKYPYMANAAYLENDLAFYKTFPIKGTQNVQFRFGMGNWMNHPLPQFSSNNQLKLNYLVDYQTKAITPNTATNSPTFGFLDQKSGAPSQRIISLDLKYIF